jgi:hypothetical protein
MSPGKICPKNSLRENLEILVLFSSKSLFQYCHLIQWAFQFLEGGRVQFSLNGVGKLSEGCKIFLVCVCVGGGGCTQMPPSPPRKFVYNLLWKQDFKFSYKSHARTVFPVWRQTQQIFSRCELDQLASCLTADFPTILGIPVLPLPHLRVSAPQIRLFSAVNMVVCIMVNFHAVWIV